MGSTALSPGLRRLVTRLGLEYAGRNFINMGKGLSFRAPVRQVLHAMPSLPRPSQIPAISLAVKPDVTLPAVSEAPKAPEPPLLRILRFKEGDDLISIQMCEV